MVIAYDSQLLGIQHLRASAEIARSIVPDVQELRLPEAIMDLIDRVYAFTERPPGPGAARSGRTASSTRTSAPPSTASWRS